MKEFDIEQERLSKMDKFVYAFSIKMTSEDKISYD